MKKHIFRIILIVAILAIIIFAVVHYFQSKIKYNEGYVNGNTAGNLYNSGMFCESNGTVFFANPDDEYRLYSMDPNGDNLKKLCNDSVMSINADEHYVYYVRSNSNSEQQFPYIAVNTNSLCRIDRKGGEVTILDRDPSLYALLIGNYVYYMHYDEHDASTLYRIGIDGKDKEQLADYAMYTCNAFGQYFYYNGMQQDGKLYRYDTATNTATEVYDCNCYKPIVTNDNNAYYLDVNQNNALVHTNLEFDNPITLTTDSIDTYNVYGSYIYYQRYSETSPALCMIKNDGTEFSVLAYGNYSNICVTSHYIYFTDFKTKEVRYTSTSNPGEIKSFHPGVIE